MTHLDADVGDSEDAEAEAGASERVAREQLATRITSYEKGGIPHQSNLGTLDVRCWNIREALLEGDRPDPEDLEMARTAMECLKEDIEDIEALFGMNPLDHGATFGEATEEQREEFDERQLQAE